jgi:hypothetical protein
LPLTVGEHQEQRLLQEACHVLDGAQPSVSDFPEERV